jgi:hypothetical protein
LSEKPKLVDRAYEVLSDADIASTVAEDLYDLFYVCESSRDLKARLAPLPLTYWQKDALVRAKAKDEIDPCNAEKTASARAANSPQSRAYEVAAQNHTAAVRYVDAASDGRTQQE